MKMKKNPFFFTLIISLLLFCSCSTMKFGRSAIDTLYAEDDEPQARIREFDLSYNYKIMGVKVSGKSIVEDLFILNDKTLFIVISFPRVGILKSNDFGKSFQSTFFNNRYLEKAYNYNKEESEDEGERPEKREEITLSRHFATSHRDREKALITIGPYLYLTEDAGDSWSQKSVFLDIENTHIREVVVTENDEIYLFTNNRMAYSKDWGRKWEKRAVKLEGIPPFKMELVSAHHRYGTLFASFRHRDESNASLARLSYERLYKGESRAAGSGLFISEDRGLSWGRAGLDLPVVLWDYEDRIYALPPYELSFYNESFSEEFRDSLLYRKGELTESSYEAEELIEILQESGKGYLELLPLNGGKLFSFNDKSVKNLEIVDNKDYNCSYRGNKVLANNDFVHRESLIDESKGVVDFYYSYNPYRLFKIWMGLKSNPAAIYAKGKENRFYRIVPDKLFLKHFFKYVVLEKARINSINPFLRKPGDVDFFKATLDPTKGFPVEVELLEAEGWTLFEDSAHINRIINPLGNKRSEFFWYKNVDKKKSYKLQFTFGKEDGINFLVYPYKLLYYKNALLMINNYYSLEKSYMDLYIMELTSETKLSPEL